MSLDKRIDGRKIKEGVLQYILYDEKVSNLMKNKANLNELKLEREKFDKYLASFSEEELLGIFVKVQLYNAARAILPKLSYN